MPEEEVVRVRPQPRVGAPRSDPRTLPAGKDYNLALRFNKRRPGLAAFEWVAVWRTERAQGTRSFPLDAHGFAEALQGAVTTVYLETGVHVPKDELEIAGFKERRVNKYWRAQALERAAQATAPSDTHAADSGGKRSDR